MKNGRARKRVWIAAVAGAALLITLGANAGRMLVVDAPESSDVILVLAGETDRRPAKGLQLLDQGYGRSLVIDVPAAAMVYNFSQVELAQKYAQGLPQAAAVRICPIVGLSTRAEAHDVEKCLAGMEGRRILIVTSEYHTRRALSIFRHEVRGRYFSMAAARDEREFGTAWWRRREWAKTSLAEWERLLWWSAVDRWR
jgi:hypothetical protein